jgi:hypothetical protein
MKRVVLRKGDDEIIAFASDIEHFTKLGYKVSDADAKGKSVSRAGKSRSEAE